jgi:hypothetical protein
LRNMTISFQHVTKRLKIFGCQLLCVYDHDAVRPECLLNAGVQHLRQGRYQGAHG